MKKTELTQLIHESHKEVLAENEINKITALIKKCLKEIKMTPDIFNYN